jgi:hypothetical protein
MSGTLAFGLLCLGVVGLKVVIWTLALNREERGIMGKGDKSSKSGKGGKGKGC